MADDNDNFFNELANDSDSEGEFDGFDIDATENDTIDNSDVNFEMDNWHEGDRDATELVFTGRPGVAVDISEDPTCLELFELFFPNEAYQQISDETNRYARDFLENKATSTHSRYNKWVDTTPDEIVNEFT